MALTEKLTSIADAIRAKSGKTEGLTLSQMPLEIASIRTGTELNFEVVANPRPASAKENTIWVNTDSITSWAFSALAPETPEEGMVWITTGSVSPIGFNALKENAITLCPISAWQYSGGAWENREAKTCRGGSWEGWLAYLYDAGNEYTDITGGWVKKNKVTSSTNTGSITKNADHIYIKNVTSGSTGMVTANQIDLSAYTKLHCVCKCSNALSVTVAKDFPTTSSNYAVNAVFEFPNNEEVVVDISTVDEPMRIGVFDNNAKGAYVYSLWLS